jgi:hypothetical protein
MTKLPQAEHTTATFSGRTLNTTIFLTMNVHFGQGILQLPVFNSEELQF